MQMTALEKVIPVLDVQEYVLGRKFKMKVAIIHYAECRYDAYL